MESGELKKTLSKNPREGANPLSVLFFVYTLPIFWKGRKRNLDTNDLYKELKEHKADYLGDKLCIAWEKELANSKANKKPNLLRATLKVFGWQLVVLGLVVLVVEFLFKVSQPLLLGGLIAHYSPNEDTNIDDKKDITEAYIYAGAVVLTSALSVLFMHSYMLGTLHIGMKIRLAMCSMIYRKALRLSKTALSDTTAGQVVNLLSNDVGRLDLSAIFINYLWLGPVETIVITYLMYIEIGLSSLVGVGFMLAFIPLQAFLGKKLSTLRLKTALRTDERVRMMNEIIQGIQVIKMYAWEKPFGKMVALARKKEIDIIRSTSYIRGILMSFIMFLTRVSIFMSLATYALLGYFLSARTAFVITAYYNILRPTMTVFFPQGIGQLAETLVSIKRIQKFMQYNETEIKPVVNSETQNSIVISDSNPKVEESIEKHEISDEIEGQPKEPQINDNSNATLSEAGIDISHIKAKWDESTLDYTLDNVSLRVQPGTMVAIIGPVGAGKSSLIQAILGELPIEDGKIKINGTISYASQEPWLFSGTVRQNILFGLQMDRKRYKTVVKKCALERDFEIFPFGDKTIVGERGTSLSGGQKARISLARAVYRKSTIYLLDDPLSAVDTHVGRHLFDQCMRDFLRNDIVVLVTHQLQFLQHADQIVILDHGKVSAVGSYETLRDSGLDFAKMLADPESKEDDAKTNVENRMRQRQNSETSMNSIEEKADDNRMQVQESQQQGAISLSLYGKYFKAGGGFCFVAIMVASCVISQFLASGGDWFLSYWVNKEKSRHPYAEAKHFSSNQTLSTTTMNEIITDLIPPEQRLDPKREGTDEVDIYIFTGITIATIILTVARSFLFFTVAMKASRNLHNAMFNGITRATMYFFNTNPSGRILNRFSKDMGQIDEILPSVMIDVIQIFLQLFGIVIVVAVVNQYFLIPTVILGVLFYYLRKFYLKTSRDVKRMEAVTRSPIYSHLSASLNGLATIRAFGAQDILIHEFDNHQNLHSSAYFMFVATSRAFGFWLDCCCVIYIGIVTLSFFLFELNNGGNIGLAITQAMGMTGMVQWGMRQSAELENTMTSVERVVEYESVDPEAELEAAPDQKPPETWPEHGKIEFVKLSLRYFPDPNAENVLKSLEFEILPHEKVGIVGRTGAGKSSLINAVFRLSYNEGSIIIDNRNINKMGLHDLRSKISIIPQEPVLFSGTMRYNLDPFDEYSDAKLWEALQEVKLKSVVNELAHGLQSKISEGGSNFSVGQRQLVCLARAILRENKILVMDEATANVDPQTDALIQATIRDKFMHCTVLTIAHRLHTVMDSDKVLVMDAGEAVEFGTPYDLLTKSDKKIFEGMVKQLGKGTYDALFKVTEEVHNKKKTGI